MLSNKVAGLAINAGVLIALLGASAAHASATDFPECAEMAAAIGAPVSRMLVIADDDAPDGYFTDDDGEGRHCNWKLDLTGKELLTTEDFAASMAVVSAEIKRDIEPLRKEDAAVMGFAHNATGAFADKGWVFYPKQIIDTDVLGLLGPMLVVGDISVSVSSSMAPEVQPADQPLNLGWGLSASERLFLLYSK